jgi:splicing factor 3A subunit 1
MYAPSPVMLPPLHYQGMDSAQPFGYQPAPATPAAMHPTRMAALAAANNAIQAGMVRSADEMEGGGGEEMPPAKRQKVAKLPGGALYPEEDWIAMHPVSRMFLISCFLDLPFVKHVF